MKMTQSGKSILSRKNQRKEARTQKKQRKANFFNKNQKKHVVESRTFMKGKAQNPPSKFTKKPLSEDEEILSEELMSDISDSELESFRPIKKDSESEEEDLPFSKGYNKYGTEDPILAAAEEALDNGLYDSEGNIDSEGFEGLFGDKFEEGSQSSADDEDEEEEALSLESDTIDSEESAQSDLKDEDGDDSKEIVVEARETVKLEPSECRLVLMKKVKGLLNRLSIGNFESIASSLNLLYNENPRREVTEVITDSVILSILNQANLLDSFVLVFTALMATLCHLVGVEFGAYVLQKITEIMEENRQKLSQGSETTSYERNIMNLVTFLAYLYDLQIVSNKIIGDIVQEAVLNLSELDVEIILKLVRNCGAQFRRDDPKTLKDIIISLNERLVSVPKEKQSSRFKFMLENIYDLKNNKLQASLPGELENVKKLLRNIVQSRGISKFEPLRIGLDDIRNADTRGKWWLVGGTWAPESTMTKAKETKGSNAMDTLAKEQRMNTDVRKAIFGALISSDDYMDAFQRILALKLTGKQERDIALVILHCVGQEKVYNPFYALVARQFIQWKHNHLITFKYSFWDWMGQKLEGESLRKISHMAQFFSFLISSMCLPLSIAKKADFLHLSEKEIIFWQMLLGRILTETAQEETLINILKSLSGNRKAVKEDQEEAVQEVSENLNVLKAGLALFLQFHLESVEADKIPFIKKVPLLRGRIALTKQYLK